MAVVISGSNGVSHVNNGAITQADLSAGVAGNGPTLIVSSNGVGGLVNASTAVLSLISETADTSNAFSTSTFRFTPQVAGYYSTNFKSTISGSGITRYFVALYKNGVEYMRGSDGPLLSGSEGTSLGSCLVYLNGTTDYIDLRGYFVGASGVHYTLLTSHLARSATEGGVGPDQIGVGSGQTWQNVAGSRAIGTTYTNNTGRPIMVAVSAYGSTDGTADAYNFLINGVVVAINNTSFSNGSVYQAYTISTQVIVPNGATYQLATSAGTNTIATWMELR